MLSRKIAENISELRPIREVQKEIANCHSDSPSDNNINPCFIPRPWGFSHFTLQDYKETEFFLENPINVNLIGIDSIWLGYFVKDTPIDRELFVR